MKSLDGGERSERNSGISVALDDEVLDDDDDRDASFSKEDLEDINILEDELLLDSCGRVLLLLIDIVEELVGMVAPRRIW